MASIKVTITVEIVESDGHTFTISETKPQCATGGNPGFFALDVENGIADVGATVGKAVGGRFKDLRHREDFSLARTNYVAAPALR